MADEGPADKLRGALHIPQRDNSTLSHVVEDLGDESSLKKEMGYEQELNRGLFSFLNTAFGFTEVCPRALQ
jgi:hypothetical protein